MKKKLLVILTMLPLMLSSCSSSQGVIGKSFTYSSCLSEALKTGTKEDFYSENNMFGSTKEEVISFVVNFLYTRGSGEEVKTIYFSETKSNNFTYKNHAVYELNEEESYTNGYYSSLNDDFTSIKLLEFDTSAGTLVDYSKIKERSGMSSYTGESYLYKTSFTDSSIVYDQTNKQLTIDVDVTSYYKINNDSKTNVMSYSLAFAEN